jgi:ketosteroid isomerase-like protein
MPITTETQKMNADLIESFTRVMTHEDIEGMLKLWAPEGSWEVMATGEIFSGLDKIRQLAARSMAARVHGAAEGLLPFNVFANAEATKFCWEYVHKGEVTDKWPASTKKPAVGMRFELPIVLICEISQGKLVAIREYFDLLTLTEAGTPHHLYS